MGDSVGIVAHVGRQILYRVAGALPDTLDAARGIAVEDRAVLGKGYLFGGVLRRLPVRIVGAAFHVVDHLAVQLERHTQLDQRLDLALPGEDAVPRRRDILQMAGADGREGGAARPLHIHDAASGEVAFERARGFFLDLSPRRVGYRGKLAVQIVHNRGFPLREPMPSEPSDTDGMGCGGSAAGGSVVGGESGVTSSRNVADGTKKRLPVTARLKSRIRS